METPIKICFLLKLQKLTTKYLKKHDYYQEITIKIKHIPYESKIHKSK